jgi:hypothetical protein
MKAPGYILEDVISDPNRDRTFFSYIQTGSGNHPTYAVDTVGGEDAGM